MSHQNALAELAKARADLAESEAIRTRLDQHIARLIDLFIRERNNNDVRKPGMFYDARLRNQNGDVVWRSFATKAEAIQAVCKLAGIEPASEQPKPEIEQPSPLEVPDVWITGTDAARLLQTYVARVVKLARAGEIACRTPKGGHPRYRLRDVLKLAQATPAT